MQMRLQVVLDDALGRQIQNKANDLGFSISAYVRYLLKKSLNNSNKSGLDLALDDLKNGNVEEITLAEFNKQIEDLY
jgi:16S rRNA U516 pseudouridylate synthase RsuA-like enzyme